MSKGRYHVISRNGNWAVKREGATKAQGIYTSKNTASKVATKYQSKNYDVVIHDTDGTISAWRHGK